MTVGLGRAPGPRRGLDGARRHGRGGALGVGRAASAVPGEGGRKGGLRSHQHGRAKGARQRAAALGRAFRAARVIRGRSVRWEASPPVGDGGGGGPVERAPRRAVPPPRPPRPPPRRALSALCAPTGDRWP